jgi:hypothetical protein
MNTFQIHLLTNGSMKTTFWIRTDKCASLWVAQGLPHLHKCNPIIVHLDIKPQNILLDKDYTPKLLILGWQNFQMVRMKMWYVPHQSFFN